ncbi:MAG: aminotransferase class V-fold PLP-dependent enzyme [Saprospiraceae bacterium]
MSNRPELSLDPQNWDTLKQIGHQMVDDMFDYLNNIRNEPVWRPVPERSKEYFEEDLPQRPQDIASLYEAFKTHILPYPQGNIHPRFWGWVMGSGTPVAMLAEMLAAAMNSNVCIDGQAAVLVEQQVLNWCKQLVGFPETASGLLTSGASMANLTALIAAREHISGGSVRRLGLQAEPSRMVLYCSMEAHHCIRKAAEVMGLGAASVSMIPVDDQYRMRTDLLEEIIQNDLAAGRFPFCIVGNAGTVNTGAIDPLSELAALARKYSLWFHIDGAFGAFARNIPEYADALAAIGEADSLAFDLHKWMSVPYEAGCVLIRDEPAHRKAYEQTANYLIRHERQQGSGQFSFGDYGIELSRGFKALKVWMTLKHYGAFAFTALIKQNIAQARYLSESVQQHPQLELTAPTALNIVCFRYVRPGWPEEKTRAVNQEIMLRMREKGAAIVSATILKGRYTLRAAIVNHRSRMEDFDFLVEQVVRNGHELG